MPSLQDLPAEVLTESLLTRLSIDDINALGRCSRYLHAVTEDEAFWKRKILQDFKFDLDALGEFDGSSLEQGWVKKLWLGLRNPRVYIWGTTDNGRLGLGYTNVHVQLNPASRHISYPVEITAAFRNIPSAGSTTMSNKGKDRGWDSRGPGVVDLHAGGYSFAARDFDGGVWVWGQLDGSGYTNAQNFEDYGMISRTPRRLRLPCRAESISAGRRHLLVLDSDNLVWELTAWGKAFHHTSHFLTSPAHTGSSTNSSTSHRRLPHVAQICASWSHSACLTSTGDIFAWHPFLRTYRQALTGEEDLEGPVRGDDEQSGNEADDEIPVRWGRVGEDILVELQKIPERPKVESVKEGEEPEQQWSEAESVGKVSADDGRVVKIAAGDSFVAALKANGEVWMINVEEGTDLAAAEWEYLPTLSSPDIRHITGSFQTVISYSKTSVRMAIVPAPALRTPGFGASLSLISLRGLENRSITSISRGDHHSLAVTRAGECLVWGTNHVGQCGTGENGGMVEEPRVLKIGRGDKEWAGAQLIARTSGRANQNGRLGLSEVVGRDHEGNWVEGMPMRRFVFGVAAGGAHSGALVVDIKGKAKEGDKALTSEGMAELLPSPPDAPPSPKLNGIPGGNGIREESHQYQGLPPGLAGIRIGFAGRGAFRGGVLGRGRGIGRGGHAVPAVWSMEDGGGAGSGSGGGDRLDNQG